MYDDDTIYNYCDCQDLLVYYFYYLTTTVPVDPASTFYTTPTNISLLQLYEVDFNEFNTTPSYFSNNPPETKSWVNISEGSNLTLQKGFECFEDFETIGHNVFSSFH